jgi:hypothetical protein
LKPKLRFLLTSLAALSFGFSSASVAACGEQFNSTTRQIIESPNFTIAYEPSVWPIPVGKLFAVRVQVCSASSSDVVSGLKIDADMPAHKHGMNYKPSVSKQSDTVFLAQGLMFHMPGQWRMQFEFETSANPSQKVRASKEHLIE